MSEVQLPIAYDVSRNKYWHVSENIPKYTSLVCPFCSKPVSKKAKLIRRHHFFHINVSNCTPKPETLLHEGAKYYILNKLNNNEEFRISFDVNNASNPSLLKACKSINVVSFEILSSRIFLNQGYTHVAEQFIHNYKPDILSTSTFSKSFFAWEIFVSHEIEDKKADTFKSNNIPFIELIPAETGRNEYNFVISNFWGFDISLESDELFQRIFDNNQARIEEQFRAISLKHNYNDLLKRITNNAIRELNSISFLNDVLKSYNDSYLTNVYKDLLTFKFKSDFSNKIFPETGRFTKLESCEFLNGILGYYSKFNNRYFIDSPMGLLRSFFELLSDNNYLTGYANEKNIIAGVELKIFDSYFDDLHVDIAIDKYQSRTKNISLYDTRPIKSKKGFPYFIVHYSYNEYLLFNHQLLLKSIIMTLHKHFKVFLYLQRPSCGDQRYEKITGIKVIGLPNHEAIMKLSKHILATINQKISCNADV